MYCFVWPFQRPRALSGLGNANVCRYLTLEPFGRWELKLAGNQSDTDASYRWYLNNLKYHFVIIQRTLLFTTQQLLS